MPPTTQSLHACLVHALFFSHGSGGDQGTSRVWCSSTALKGKWSAVRVDTWLAPSHMAQWRQRLALPSPSSYPHCKSAPRAIYSGYSKQLRCRMISLHCQACQPPPNRNPTAARTQQQTQAPANLAHFASLPHFCSRPRWRSDHLLFFSKSTPLCGLHPIHLPMLGEVCYSC